MFVHLPVEPFSDTCLYAGPWANDYVKMHSRIYKRLAYVSWLRRHREKEWIMLGEQVGEFTGKVTSQRVLPSDSPGAQASRGAILGLEVSVEMK